jgi:hypothetical protein
VQSFCAVPGPSHMPQRRSRGADGNLCRSPVQLLDGLGQLLIERRRVLLATVSDQNPTRHCSVIAITLALITGADASSLMSGRTARTDERKLRALTLKPVVTDWSRGDSENTQQEEEAEGSKD